MHVMVTMRWREFNTVARWLPTVPRVLTCSTCTPCLRAAVEVWLFYQNPGSDRQDRCRFGSCAALWPASGSHQPVHVANCCGGSSQRDRSPEMNFWNQCLVLCAFISLSPKVPGNLIRLRMPTKGLPRQRLIFSPMLCLKCAMRLYWSKQMRPPPDRFRFNV